MIPPSKIATGTASKAAKTAVKAAAVASERTFMPWEGWINRFFREKLGEERYQKIKNVVAFRPDDIHNLEQMPRPSTKVPIGSDPDRPFASYRYPSPGSQNAVNVPKESPGHDPYNITYYSRDTRRRERQNIVGVSNKAGAEYVKKHGIQLVSSPTEAIGDGERPTSKFLNEVDTIAARVKLGSPGNKGRFATGPSDFDPSGLRATMSTNHEATDASLDKHMPTQLPTSSWMKDEEKLLLMWKEKGLPPSLGAPHKWKIPKEANTASW
mmetsp:Transcript_9494/g.21057  ORF Transcript_9494/g.21057 Transcript_9494/m.21057 type:complete len:268 (-) Transcript_9494:273-1076(-)|eukprot:CAMPEP_0113301746 /NCGR_PEP_ID=MMETSP0010_2-20120614/2844_1 /TAXON_ID=216773 ORGANISM="Corethron hystrix, Strain 308" /NCGR_SAMPLE_ID=MMETSP0010_2 /ASSEMBLY_ACC=CAM_ASM_000155 /LENGTH=267 /DNA_ID=CAMNT_0000155415 /DNA_START=76 /DNA_END=879 /DNA_ORIENTATION=- /assembly_acc=CAM_ASM_000155